MKSSNEALLATDTYPPIPELDPIAGWKDLPIIKTERSNEPLVPLGIFSAHRRILTSSVYADEHHNSPYHGGLEGSNIAIFAREGVVDKLERAASLLPRGHHLMVMDAYRPLEVQTTLYRHFEQNLRLQHPDWTDEHITNEAQKYISLPSNDETRPSPHNTGASVDLVIIKVDDEVQLQIDSIDSRLSELGEGDWEEEYLLEMKRSELLRRHGKMLEFGTKFDHGGPEAALRYYEEKAAQGTLSGKEAEALKNRRLLCDVMSTAGFAPYADEWWHYNDTASQMGAKVTGKEYAEYGAASLSEENLEFERMRKQHHENSVRLARGEEWIPPRELELHYELAKKAIAQNNPKNIWNMTDTVAKLEPTSNEKAA